MYPGILKAATLASTWWDLPHDCDDQPLYFRAIQGHSGNRFIDYSLQLRTIVVPGQTVRFLYHNTNSRIFDDHVLKEGLRPGGLAYGQGGRHELFFSTVDLR